MNRFGCEVSGGEIDAVGARLEALLEAALIGKGPVALQIPGSGQVLRELHNCPEFAVALATGGLRLSAELKLRHAGLPFAALPLASSSDAVSREDILRIAAARAADKYTAQFAQFTYVGDGAWDVTAARKLGWRFIGFGSGNQADRLRQAGAEIVLPHWHPIDGFLSLLAGDAP